MSLLTVQETATRLKVHPLTVRRYVASGRLQSVRVGRGVRIDEEALDQFLGRTAPTENPGRSDAAALAKPLSADHGLWGLAGLVTEGPATDAARIHDLLANVHDVRRRA